MIVGINLFRLMLLIIHTLDGPAWRGLFRLYILEVNHSTASILVGILPTYRWCCDLTKGQGVDRVVSRETNRCLESCLPNYRSWFDDYLQTGTPCQSCAGGGKNLVDIFDNPRLDRDSFILLIRCLVIRMNAMWNRLGMRIGLIFLDDSWR